MIHTRMVWGALAVAVLALAPRSASAQVYTPTFMSPLAERSAGIYVSDLDPGDFAAEGILRGNFGGFDLGFRGGVVDYDDQTSLTLGGELRNPISGTAPINLAFTAAAQAILGDVERFGAQAGLSIGHAFRSPQLTLVPYIHPRVALVDRAGRDDELDAELLADAGLDIGFGTGLQLRIGVGLEDLGSDWGIGLAWRR